MRKVAVPLACTLAALALFAAPLAAQHRVDWRGYTQVRFSYGSSVSSFAVRRAKLWIGGPAPIGEGFYFKVQGLFRPTVSGAFVLQDVYAEYRWGPGSLRLGQMVPDFSLQRHQPDFEIPLLERAAVINVLIPDAGTLARDIGAQVTLAAHRSWHASVGLFNGNGANHLANEDRQFLMTGRATYSAGLLPGVDLGFGASVAYRETDGIDFSKILGGGDPFAGRDFRWGVETHISASRWEVQAEYLQSNLGGELAWGYYAFADYHVTAKNQIVASTERLQLPNPDVDGDPWYILGFNHYIAGQQAKLMLDLRAHFTDARTRYLSIMQFQLFFH